jgi:hypothetical protein
LLVGGYPLICATEVIVLLVLVFILYIHETVALVHHVLLASAGVLVILATEEAQVAKLDSFGDVSEKTFERDNAVDVENVEGVPDPHMVEALLHTRTLFVAKQADPQRVQGRTHWLFRLLVDILFWWDRPAIVNFRIFLGVRIIIMLGRTHFGEQLNSACDEWFVSGDILEERRLVGLGVFYKVVLLLLLVVL